MSQNLAAFVARAYAGGIAPLNLDAEGNLLVNIGGVPSAIDHVTATSGDVAASSAVATLPGVAGKTTFITGFTITGSGATAAAQVVAALTGVIGGPLDYVISVPAGATVGLTPLNVSFPTPIPASGLNTDIVLTLPSLGTGNLHACVTAYGFQQ